MDNEMMNGTPYGKAARKKLGLLPDNFVFYRAEWLSESAEGWSRMRVHGAEFSGGARVPGTERSAIVTRDEMAACE